MSDFVQTMKDWRRMCQFMDKEYGNSSCDKCPLGGCSAVYEMCGKENFANMERDISAWAAEHPEPVYPSIAKYLEQFGITIRRDGSLQADFFKANEPMGADMAKLLGISLGEGENEKTD
jgi:hypothetical protein